MSLIMRLLKGVFVRRHDQAKRCTAHLIEPVCQKLDFIFLLNSQIQLVSMCYGTSSRSFDVVAIHIQRHFLRLLSSITPAGCATRHHLVRTRDAVDLPDLSGEGDEVRGVPDELERGRPIQAICDDGERTVPVDLDERAGVRECRRTRIAAHREDALRESVETAAAKFHVNEEWGA